LSDRKENQLKETTFRGIVISSRDYKENDKLLSILTAEQGLLTAVARSVKLQKSKLKPYAQSFCFADFEVASKGGMYVLTGANPIDSFFDLTLDMDKLTGGFEVLEVARTLSREGAGSGLLFLTVLKALRVLCYEGLSPKLVLLKFLCDVMAMEGFRLNLLKCAACNQAFLNGAYLNPDDGEVVCTACKKPYFIPIPPAVQSSMRILGNTQFEALKTIKIKESILNDALGFMTSNFNHKFGVKLKQF
jgi:DNA repair protein RecO (recombination protein O)